MYHPLVVALGSVAAELGLQVDVPEHRLGLVCVVGQFVEGAAFGGAHDLTLVQEQDQDADPVEESVDGQSLQGVLRGPVTADEEAIDGVSAQAPGRRSRAGPRARARARRPQGRRDPAGGNSPLGVPGGVIPRSLP